MSAVYFISTFLFERFMLDIRGKQPCDLEKFVLRSRRSTMTDERIRSFYIPMGICTFHDLDRVRLLHRGEAKVKRYNHYYQCRDGECESLCPCFIFPSHTGDHSVGPPYDDPVQASESIKVPQWRKDHAEHEADQGDFLLASERNSIQWLVMLQDRQCSGSLPEVNGCPSI